MRNEQRGVFLCLIAIALFVSSSCSSSSAASAADVPEPCAADMQLPTVEGNPEIEAPVTIRRVEPHVGRELRGRVATATVEAVIGQDGKPRNICVTAGDREWGRVVAEALRQWEFKPATLNGAPVAVKFTLTSRWSG